MKKLNQTHHRASLIPLLLMLTIGLAHAQRDISREIVVYFKSGVQRSFDGISSRITSSELATELARFQLDSSAIEPAFPKFKEADTLKTLVDGRLVGQANFTKIFKVTVPNSFTVDEVLKTMKNRKDVLFAERNGRVTFDSDPTDIYFGYQWNLKKIKAPEAWEIFSGTSNTKIAIIDTGVDTLRGSAD
jgi:hypothetical protein